MKKVCFLLALLLLLSGCSGDPVATEQTGETTTVPILNSTAATTVPHSAGPSATIHPAYVGCEFFAPEDGVLILREDTVLEDMIIEGDVYITANAAVTFDRVLIRGRLFVHGKLSTVDPCSAGGIFTYKIDDTLCSAYDGICGEIISVKGGMINCVLSEIHVTENALDYAFDAWGKETPEQQPLTEIGSVESGSSSKDPAEVRILSGKQTLAAVVIDSDVYIPADGDISFYSVTVKGNVYVAGKLHFADFGYDYRSKIEGRLYAYNFGIACDAFDGNCGQVTGGPVCCYQAYVVANDALDYAFDTWEKQ